MIRPLRVALVAVFVALQHAIAADAPATRPAVFKAQVVPHWTDDSHFWYRNDLPGGRREIVTIDIAAGTRVVSDAQPSTRPTTDAAMPTTGPTSRPRPPRPRRENDDAGDRPAHSPDGQRVALLRDNNVCLGDTESDAKPITTDGKPDQPYDRVFFSPDGRAIVAWRIERGDHKDVYRLESSPRGKNGRRDGGVGRAVLHTDEYPLPGDKLDSFELSVFDAQTGMQTKPAVDPIDADQWGSHPSPRPRWRGDGHRFVYEKYDRGHQRVRLIEVDALTGDTRTLLDEQSQTFIWTAHAEGQVFNYLRNGREVIYVSDRSGWRQPYLLNLDTAELTPITQGQWVMRGIQRVEEEKRQLWFQACGVYRGQDPYFVHYGRVNFDGTGLTWLTDADGTHTIDFRRPNDFFSPAGSYLIVTHSRVDLPPVTELRRTSDGKKIMDLERAETVGDTRPLIPFVAKGRDGATDIYGVVCLPKNYDPEKKYPVLENVYAGPQGAYVPKAFRPSYYWFTDLADTGSGFVVVQADGMGTAYRSKAFHDICWKNLADAGFPDRIAWIKAAAGKFPGMDLTRVGIYGTSAGGQNACGALIFHGDFYKAAVANCGCHDNRMDKISWNEQWMGWPVGPQYSASSNIDNAAKLKGRLQLVLGELDDNVPVESTYRLVDALVRAGKEFDFVLIPGAGHGADSPITGRKLKDFFVRSLQGVEPTKPN